GRSHGSCSVARKNTLFFSSRRRHTRFSRDWSSDVCSSDLDVADRVSGGHGNGRQGGNDEQPDLGFFVDAEPDDEQAEVGQWGQGTHEGDERPQHDAQGGDQSDEEAEQDSSGGAVSAAGEDASHAGPQVFGQGGSAEPFGGGCDGLLPDSVGRGQDDRGPDLGASYCPPQEEEAAYSEGAQPEGAGGCGKVEAAAGGVVGGGE